MDETFDTFCRRVQTLSEAKGWRFAPGLREADLDAWEARIGFVFPPEMRQMLSLGYPVAARKEDMRSVGPVTRQHDGKVSLRVRGRHFMIPGWLARSRPVREATYTHWRFVDWGNTKADNVAFVEELARQRQLDHLRFEIQKKGAWPLEWGPRPVDAAPKSSDGWTVMETPGGSFRYNAAIDRVIDQHIGEVPPLIPLDSRSLIASAPEPGQPVFMYWFGSLLHLDSFDLAGFLAARVGIFPPDMTVIPRWTFWSQFAEIASDPDDSNRVRREHDVLVRRMQTAPDPTAVYRSFHRMHPKDDDPDPGLWAALTELGPVGPA